MQTNLYKVERIIGHRLNSSTKNIEYKVKWEGYPLSQCTWEPINHLTYVHEMIEQYNKQHKTKSSVIKNHPIHKQTHKNDKKSDPSSLQSSEKRIKQRNLKRKDFEQSKQEEEKIIKRGKIVEIEEKSSEHEKEQELQQVEDVDKQEPKIGQKSQVQNEEKNEEKQDDRGSYSVWSDSESEVEVVDALKDINGELFFQVRFPDKILCFSHNTMKKRFPLELISFYEKYLTLSRNND